MNKIAEEKALEAYPLKYDNLLYNNVDRRIGYRQGYDQAMKDFLEKVCKWLKENSERYVRFDEVGYRCYAYNLLTKDFKNYIENESKT